MNCFHFDLILFAIIFIFAIFVSRFVLVIDEIDADDSVPPLYKAAFFLLIVFYLSYSSFWTIKDIGLDGKYSKFIKAHGYTKKDALVFRKLYNINKRDIVFNKLIQRDYDLWDKGKLFNIESLISKYGCSKMSVRRFLHHYKLKENDILSSPGLHYLIDSWQQSCKLKQQETRASY